MSLYEQSKQRLQIKTAVFGEERDPESLNKAAKFLQGVAEKWARGVVRMSDLKALRNRMAEEQNTYVWTAYMLISFAWRPGE